MAVSISNTIVVHDDRSLANVANFKTINDNAILGAGDITPTSDMELIGVLRAVGTNPPTINLTSLNLTTYTYLIFSVNNVRIGGNDGGDSRITLGQTTADDVVVTPTIVTGTGVAQGIIEVYLNNGICSSFVIDSSASSTDDIVSPRSRQTPLRSNSTSITIATDNNGTFTSAGNVSVYGVFGDP